MVKKIIILVFLIWIAIPINSSIVFFDGFESGNLSNWDSTSTDGDNIVEVQSEFVKQGRYAFSAQDNDPVSNQRFALIEINNLVLTTTATVSFWYFASSGCWNSQGTTSAGGARLRTIVRMNNTKSAFHSINITQDITEVANPRLGMNFNLTLSSASGVSRGTSDSEKFDVDMLERNWFHFEVMLPSFSVNTDTCRWWINGREQTPLTRDYYDYRQGWDGLEIGEGTILNTGLGENATATTYWDNVFILDEGERVGMYYRDGRRTPRIQ